MSKKATEPRVPDTVLDSLFLASIEDDANEQVMLVRPLTVRRMITEIRHHRAVEARQEFLCDVTYSSEAKP